MQDVGRFYTYHIGWVVMFVQFPLVALSQQLSLYGTFDVQRICVDFGALVESLGGGALRHMVLSFRDGGGAFDCHRLIIIARFPEGTSQTHLRVHFLTHFLVHILAVYGILYPHGPMVNAGSADSGYMCSTVHFAITGFGLVGEVVLNRQELSTNDAFEAVLMEHNIMYRADLLCVVHLGFTSVASVTLLRGGAE